MALNQRDDGSCDDSALPPPYVPSVRPPPVYSELQDSRADLSSRPSRSLTFSAIEESIASAKHSYEIRPDDDGGFSVHKCGNNNPLYQITLHAGPKIVSILMWNETRDCNLIVAQAKVPKSGQRGFEICIHPAVFTAELHWIPVGCKDGGVLKSESYSFTTADRPLTWKRTHSTSLGSSRFAGHDLKLLDDSRVGQRAHPHTNASAVSQSFTGAKYIAGGDVMAVYTQHGTNGATASRHMQLDWLDDYGGHIETAALITLMAILELSKSNIRSSGSIRARARTLRSRAGSIRSNHSQHDHAAT